MRSRSFRIALSLIALGALACATPPSNTRPLGASKRALEVRQMQNPEASEKTVYAEGTGAGTSAAILENYRTNQKTEIQERRQDRQRDRGISEIGQDN